MTVLIRFNTDMFQVELEPPNPINPIPGASLLIWLGEKLGGTQMITAPEAEDWGWFSHIDWDGSQYMLGSSASDDEGGEREWVLQVVRIRTLKERLLGCGKITQPESCAACIIQLISSEPKFRGVQVESAA